MARKYKKAYGSRRPLKTVKYSNETSNITSNFSISQGAQIKAPLISASSIQGNPFEADEIPAVSFYQLLGMFQLILIILHKHPQNPFLQKISQY